MRGFSVCVCVSVHTCVRLLSRAGDARLSRAHQGSTPPPPPRRAQAYAYYKTNRTFRLVDDDSFTPPWCLPLRVTGHTFPESAEHFLAKVAVSVARVGFPACHVGDAVYARARDAHMRFP